jgi:hypothetical protein
MRMQGKAFDDLRQLLESAQSTDQFALEIGVVDKTPVGS